VNHSVTSSHLRVIIEDKYYLLTREHARGSASI
jgi:hypothetical protein